MSMKLNGCDLITIIKAGRWMSLTFLTYIHNQIVHLGANITHHIETRVPFFSLRIFPVMFPVTVRLEIRLVGWVPGRRRLLPKVV